MFKNIAFLVKPVDGRKPANDSPLESDVLEGVAVAEKYAGIIKDVVTHTALIVGGVFIVCKIVERICR